MTNLYRHQHSDNATTEAQRNLEGRTHYVEPDTLRFHKSRVLATRVVDDGLLFALIESVSLDFDNTRRGYRYVVFNIFGHVISRASLKDVWSTRKAAEKAMWAFLNAVDAKSETLKAIERVERQHAQEMSDLRALLIKAAA